MKNYFDDKHFQNELTFYPLILWPSLFFIIDKDIKEYSAPPKPKAPEPPGCLSSLFGMDGEYKKKYDEFLKDKAWYDETEEENYKARSYFISLLREPHKYPREYSRLIKAILTKKVSVTTSDISKKGLAEETFGLSLNKYFPNEIITDKGIVTSQFKNPNFTPDFVFSHLTSNLKIDIEVDEPYTLETREPIHYRYLKRENHKFEIINTDQYRNDCFSNNTWFIVRFTEEQVLKQPDECCHLLADLIETLTQDTKYKDKFTRIKYPRQVKSWTIKHSIKLAEESYRESYLGLPKSKTSLNLSFKHKKQLEELDEFLSNQSLRSRISINEKIKSQFDSLK
jgi:hypothetical protein